MHVPMVMRALYGSRPPKVVAVVRHPVLRLHSAYWGYPHYHNKYGRTAEGFRQYVVEQVAAFRACVGRNHTARECAIYFEALGMDEEKVYFHCDQLLRGMYSVWLEVWQRFLPPSSLLVLKAEDFFADQEATLRRVAEFLGLGPLQPEVLAKMLAAGQHKSYASGVGPMLPEAKQLLVDFYRPYNEHMARLTDDARYLEWNTVPDPQPAVAAAGAAAGKAAGTAERRRRLQRRRLHQ